MKTLQNICLLAISLSVSSAIYAQNLVITLSNTSTERFAISDIQSIKFDSASMTLFEWNGTVNTWAIKDIENYAFDELSNIIETATVKIDDLKVYPNPSSNKVHINYQSSRSADISIHIYDISGKLINTLFDGTHHNKTEVTWHAKQNEALPAGKYLIKITTESKVISKSVIIQ
jgi:hypothetical protein